MRLGLFSSSSSSSLFPWGGSSGGNVDLKSYGLNAFNFWLLYNGAQRIAGIARIHSGSPRIIKFGFGMASLACCTVGSFVLTKQLCEMNDLSDLLDGDSWKRQLSNKKDILRHCYASFALFALLERGRLQTVIPSSVYSPGSFANLRFGSLSVQSDVASSAQRAQMQRFGNLFGCHHCGTRQWFSFPRLFIADHQPPTKVVGLRNKHWLAQLFRVKHEQRLYPQCQSCSSIQSAAVRQMVQRLVYHHKPRIYHLAPAFSSAINDIPDCRKYVDQAINLSISCYDKVVDWTSSS